MPRIVLTASCIVLLIMVSGSIQAQVPPDPGGSGPYAVAHVTVTTTNPDTGSELVTDIHYPSSDGTVDPGGAPYATLVFAPGFLASPSSYPGNGEHLASWGYIVAIPDFPDEDIEVRASDIQYLFSYLEAEDANGDSRFFRKIDADRFGLVGHSLGGVSTMMVAARDGRIKAAVALDPANRPSFIGGGWDYEGEAADITAPLAVIGAPAQLCNVGANYNDMYAFVGADHKAKFVIANGSHCDFMDTDPALQTACSVVCFRAFSEARLQLAERYAAAWFNYYLRSETEYYTYLYGDKANEDVQAGRIARDVQTTPRGLTAMGQLGAVELSWTLPDYPIIAGYNVYRSQQSGNYPSAPYAQVGRASSYVDTEVVPGQRYFYVLRSRDAAGNKHQPSNEVSAVPEGISTPTLTPTTTATATPTSTSVSTPIPTLTTTATATPTSTSTSTPALTPTATATATPTSTPSAAATSTPTVTPTSTYIVTSTVTPTSTATPFDGDLKHRVYLPLIWTSDDESILVSISRLRAVLFPATGLRK